MSRTDRPEVTAVIVNYNGGVLLLRCLDSLVQGTRVSLEIIVVDNDSRDGSAAAARARHPRIILIENRENVGFARASNQGMSRARGRRLLLVNPDVVVGDGAVDTLHAYLEAHPEVGMCGPRVLLPSGHLDRPCRRTFKTPATYLYKALGLTALFPRHRVFGRYYLGHLDDRRTTDVDAVIGAFLMARRELVEAIGPLDERFFLYCEDEDWCLRAKRAGYKVLYVAEATVVHAKSASARQRPLRSLCHWHRAVFQFHRKNIAPDYGALVNAAVYAGMGAAFAVRAVGAAFRFGRRRPQAPSRVAERGMVPAGGARS